MITSFIIFILFAFVLLWALVGIWKNCVVYTVLEDILNGKSEHLFPPNIKMSNLDAYDLLPNYGEMMWSGDWRYCLTKHEYEQVVRQYLSCAVPNIVEV